MTLSELERRVMGGDTSLTPNDFARAHGIVDGLYAKHADALRRSADSFSRRAAGPRVVRAVRRAGIELSLPAGEVA